MTFLVQYNKNFDSSYNISCQEARVANVATVLISSGFVQGAIESSYCRYARSTKLVERFSKALRLVEKRSSVAESGNSVSAGDALGVTPRDKAKLCSTKKHDLLPYIKGAAAHTRSKK